MMRAVWDGVVLAEAPRTVRVEGNGLRIEGEPEGTPHCRRPGLLDRLPTWLDGTR